MVALFRSAALAIFIAFAGTAEAGTGNRVELISPRPFGYLIGDVFDHEAIITLEPGAVTDKATLPRPGPLSYWLDLVASDLDDLGIANEGHIYRLRLKYQTFYAPLEPKSLATPELTLGVLSNGSRSEIKVPAWQFLMSPLREIIAGRAGAAMALQPDVRPRFYPLALEWKLLLIAGAVAVFSLTGLAWLRGWGPFCRNYQPFIYAARKVAQSLAASSSDGYRQALLALHRGFDAAAGKRLLADDIETFVARRPGFRSLSGEIARFFAASRQLFFGAREEQAKAVLPASDLEELARRLASLERSGA
jgi:mxaA protein